MLPGYFHCTSWLYFSALALLALDHPWPQVAKAASDFTLHTSLFSLFSSLFTLHSHRKHNHEHNNWSQRYCTHRRTCLHLAHSLKPTHLLSFHSSSSTQTLDLFFLHTRTLIHSRTRTNTHQFHFHFLFFLFSFVYPPQKEFKVRRQSFQVEKKNLTCFLFLLIRDFLLYHIFLLSSLSSSSSSASSFDFTLRYRFLLHIFFPPNRDTTHNTTSNPQTL